ncbi:MAG: hypothetical protein ABF274_12010 [Nonlabens sp.]|uniref:hypothetical protein n=1 Tax=Nonlabens sp. TaxID=1888209 RepID=UPI003219AB70
MVNTALINQLLAHPESIHVDHLEILEDVVQEFPFFQAARSLYLKGLKLQSSPLYNKELQKTATHTTDRSVLFDFITSESFLQNEVSEQIKLLQQQENDFSEADLGSPSIGPVKEEDLNSSKDFTKVTDIDLFEKKKEVSIVDQPLEFDQNETYSFSKWLQLTTLQPIERETEKRSDVTSNNTTESKASYESNIKPNEEKNNHILDTTQEVDDRARKMARIDQFLAEKPKIRPRKSTGSAMNIANDYEDPSQFMTETLAKVYIAQKNYSKALKAYEVLVLQHPEKSGLFADQIQEIKNLQSNHT